MPWGHGECHLSYSHAFHRQTISIHSPRLFALGRGQPFPPPTGRATALQKGRTTLLGNIVPPRVQKLDCERFFPSRHIVLPSTSAVMSELSGVEDAPAVADPSAVLPAAPANGSALSELRISGWVHFMIAVIMSRLFHKACDSGFMDKLFVSCWSDFPPPIVLAYRLCVCASRRRCGVCTAIQRRFA